MSKSNAIVILLLLGAAALAGYVALAPASSDRPPVEIPPVIPPATPAVEPPPANQPPPPATPQPGTPEPGNLTQAPSPPPATQPRRVPDPEEFELALPADPNPMFTKIRGELEKALELDHTTDEFRKAFLRLLPDCRENMTPELADFLAGALTVIQDESSRLYLLKRFIAAPEIYGQPALRELFRRDTNPGIVAAVVHTEARLADIEAVRFLRSSQLDAPDDPMNGLARWVNVAPTLINNTTPECDDEILDSLRRVREIVQRSSDIDLTDVFRGKLDGLSPERRLRYDEVLAGR